MAFLHSSLFSCFAFVVLASTLLYTPQVHGWKTQSRHMVSVRSLLPSSTCSSSKDLNTSRLKVVHLHGPCSPVGTSRSREPSHVKLLDQDQARVDSLHHRISTASSRDSTRSSLAATIPAYSGGPLGTGNYIVTVGFGTPKRELTVVFDTGSDLTWIQCKPCSSSSCYPQQQPLFDPSRSSTYSKISCSSSECALLDSSTCSASSLCRYDVEYGDQSHSSGYFSRDTLTLTASEPVPSFMFGCGDENSGLFGMAAGLLGLGREKVSLVSQAGKYGGVFSYCLPPSSSSAGYLTFGDGGGAAPSNVEFTPMLSVSNMPSFYFLSLVAIGVGGKRLPISPRVFSTAGTLLDSGTVITRLPPSAYAALRSRFRQLMRKYKTAPAFSILDTCYDFTGYETVAVPTVELVFGRGTSLSVDFTGILYVANASQACLAFAGNEDASDVAIIGNVQQRRVHVVYDIAQKQIGFGAKGC